MKAWRLMAILGAALVAGLVCDWLSADRIIFRRALPPITTVPE